MDGGRPPAGPQRDIFIGTEGSSDRASIKFLQRRCKDAGLHVHLHVKSGSGGSVDVIRETARNPAKHPAKDPSSRVGDATPEVEASKSKLEIILQDPNLEGVLLRLHRGYESQQIIGSHAGMDFQNQWPEYDKSPLTADRLIGASPSPTCGSTQPAITASLRHSRTLRQAIEFRPLSTPLSHEGREG